MSDTKKPGGGNNVIDFVAYRKNIEERQKLEIDPDTMRARIRLISGSIGRARTVIARLVRRGNFDRDVRPIRGEKMSPEEVNETLDDIRSRFAKLVNDSGSDIIFIDAFDHHLSEIKIMIHNIGEKGERPSEENVELNFGLLVSVLDGLESSFD